MPNKLWYLLPAWLLIFTSNLEAQYNFDAINKLWSITDLLKQDQMPTDSAWQTLFNSKAYRYKNPGKYFVEEVKMSLILAFMPSKSEILKNNLKDNVLLKRANRLAMLEPYIRKHMNWVRENHLLDSMQNQADKLLPTSLYNCYPEPVIYFRYLDYDATADKKGLFMDILLSYDVDRYKPGLFGGHELFHYILASCEARKYSGNIPYKHQPVMRIIRQLSEEGSADLIDKPILLKDESPLMTKGDFLKLYVAHSEEKVSEINMALEGLAADSGKFTTLNEWQNLIPVNAHIPGLFMAQVIANEGFTPELTIKISNPFEFFYLYNQAAKVSGKKLPLFSKTSIEFLKYLESQYLMTP